MSNLNVNKNLCNCLFCGEKLNYFEEYKKIKCIYCEQEFSANVSCEKGHYVCDTCHSLSGINLIENYLKKTTLENPIEIANNIMKSEKFLMHGPEHHFLVPAVLITSYYNNLKKPESEKISKIMIGKKRAEDVKGGFCGFLGSCGAAVGGGIFMSIITDTTPLKKETWGLVNETTGRNLIALSKIGGPRCCKKGVFTAIKETCRTLCENFNIKLYEYEDYEIICDFTKMNRECIGKDCPYNKVNHMN